MPDGPHVAAIVLSLFGLWVFALASAWLYRSVGELARARQERPAIAAPAEPRIPARPDPDAERARREEASRRAELEARDRADARRREDARHAVELSYRLRSREIGRTTLTREDFDRLTRTYLGDEHSPDVVERRASDLIGSLGGRADDPAGERTAEALTRWHKAQQAQVDAADLPERVKGMQHALLNERFTQLLTELIERIAP